MICKHEIDGICTNPDCPLCCDACMVPDVEGVCKYEERVEENLVLTPSGCAIAAMMAARIDVGEAQFQAFWDEFSRLMKQYGYAQEG